MIQEKQLVLILLSIATMSTAICSIIGGVQAAAAQSILSLEAPPPPILFTNGSQLNLTADDKDRDIDIDPLDELPANGTVSISTALATDLDINEFPPQGVTVIIQNESITVTNHTINWGDRAAENAAAAVESNDNGDSDEDSSGSDDSEEG